jgi:hypothetical protein
MKKLILIVAFLISSISYSQLTKQYFESNFQEIKTIELITKIDIEEDVNDDKPIGDIEYTDTGISIKGNIKIWFIPYASIQFVYSKSPKQLNLYLLD